MFNNDGYGFFDLETNLETLKSMQTYVNQEDKEGRREFFSQLVELLKLWWDDVPDLRAIFQPREIEALLLDSMNDSYASIDDGKTIIKFVAKSGYKNVPKIDEDGKPILNRTTPIHLTAKYTYSHERKIVLDELFKIYDHFDANYSDESGYTHFHVACETGRVDVVEKFLKLDQDLSNLVVESTGDSPLQLALKNCERGSKKVFELLLKNGADPSLSNEEELTPLHLISQRREDDDSLELLFKLSEKKYWPVRVNCRDRLCRTPLEWAVENILPLTVGTLLSHGALLFKFVFPTESNFGKTLKLGHKYDKFELAFRVPIVINRLVEFGYKFYQSDVQVVMKFFNRHKMFHEPADREARRYGDEEFVSTSKKIRIRRNFSLQDLIELEPKKATKIVDYKDYLAIRKSWNFWSLRAKKSCAAHLFDKLARGFLRRWTLAPFKELIHYRLPILCCEMIISNLTIKDLYNVWLAAACQSDEDSENVVKSTTKRKSVRAEKSSKKAKK